MHVGGVLRTILPPRQADNEASATRLSQKKSQRYPENRAFGSWRSPLALSVRSADHAVAGALREGESAGNRGEASIIEL
jgi:hypothetical protein